MIKKFEAFIVENDVMDQFVDITDFGYKYNYNLSPSGFSFEIYFNKEFVQSIEDIKEHIKVIDNISRKLIKIGYNLADYTITCSNDTQHSLWRTNKIFNFIDNHLKQTEKQEEKSGFVDISDMRFPVKSRIHYYAAKPITPNWWK